MNIVLGLLEKYPLSRPCDAVKLLYQRNFGGGHMIADADSATEYIRAERKNAGDAPYPCENLGNGITRLYLSECNRLGLSCDTVAGMFIYTANTHKGKKAEFLRELDELSELAGQMKLPFGKEELDAYLSEYRAQNYPAVSHSPAYRQAYSPMYRIVDSRYIPLLKIFAAIDSKIASNGKSIVAAFDGRSASGKSCSAELIAKIYNAPIIHADDFFLPPSLRTAERYSEIGGNIHYERFADELLRGLAGGGEFSYRRFDCSIGDYTDEVKITPSRVIIVEGAYCLRSAFGDYADVTAFFDIGADAQMERIKERDGDYARVFKEKWIPLEEAYIKGDSVAERAELLVNTTEG